MITKHTLNTVSIVCGARCNYSCVNCFTGSDKINTTLYDPDLEIILKTIPEMPKYIDIEPGGMITLIGGEPLLYMERLEMLACAVRKAYPDVIIRVFSNGHLLGRKIDQMVDIMKKYTVSMDISFHLSGDPDSKTGLAWRQSMDKVSTHHEINKISDMHYDIANYPGCDFHIFTLANGLWRSQFKTTIDGKIKPFATGNPARSAQFGCSAGIKCSFMFNSRLYKCGSLAMLRPMLSATGQIEDPDWGKYLNYKSVDLLDFDQEKFDNFYETFGKPISECDMCNDTLAGAMRWEKRTESMIFDYGRK